MRQLRRPPLSALATLTTLVAVCASAPAFAQGNQPVFDIGTAGTATITGSLNGSVVVNPNLLFLQVTVNFGEISPLNRSAFVRVTVPVIVRTEAEYQVVASVTGSTFGTVGEALKLSDVGVGIVNMRPLADGELCTANHTVYPPFDTDPQLTYSSTPRIGYRGHLGLLTSPRTVLSGPDASVKNVKLTPQNIPGSQRNNGWTFDLLLVLAPQFFSAGTASATLTLSISRGPALACR